MNAAIELLRVRELQHTRVTAQLSQFLRHLDDRQDPVDRSPSEHHDKCHAVIGRHSFKKPAQRFDAARGSANANNGKWQRTRDITAIRQRKVKRPTFVIVHVEQFQELAMILR
jgi:hypothetical protein